MKTLDIVVLGGTGFVGRQLVAALAADGHRITVPTRRRAAHPDVLFPPSVAVVEFDIYRADALAELLRGKHAAINLVGILNERGDSGRGFERAHVELTRLLIEACRASGVKRLLQMSALNAGRGTSHYLRTRGEAESSVKFSGLDWTLFQPSVIFGRGDGLFCRFASLLKVAPVLPIAGGNVKFAPVCVGDVVEAFRRALTNPQTIGQTYELYGPDVLPLKRIVRMTAAALGLKRWVIPLPDALGRLQAEVGEWLPGKPISRDNFRSLKLDSVGGVDGLHRLGIERTPVAAVLPDILGQRQTQQQRLNRYRTGR
ncbi:MAG: complex I NDUFA9 subunit family protein [Xanthomonadaceae bacterium]|nr:complex I NDUFA9 subunit family protein [Xanthomonadaceae bacterium]